MVTIASVRERRTRAGRRSSRRAGRTTARPRPATAPGRARRGSHDTAAAPLPRRDFRTTGGDAGRASRFSASARSGTIERSRERAEPDRRHRSITSARTEKAMTPDELATRPPAALPRDRAGGAPPDPDAGTALSARAIVERLGVPDPDRTRLLERRRPLAVPLSPSGARRVRPQRQPAADREGTREVPRRRADAGRLAAASQRAGVPVADDATPGRPARRAHEPRTGARGRRVRHAVADRCAPPRAHRLSPINGGSTIRRPARRGLATYTPLLDHGYREWRALRGGRDTIAEVAIEGSVPDAAEHIVEVRLVAP